MNELGFLGGLSALAYIALEDESWPLDQTDFIGGPRCDLEVGGEKLLKIEGIGLSGPPAGGPMLLVGPVFLVVSSSVFETPECNSNDVVSNRFFISLYFFHFHIILGISCNEQKFTQLVEIVSLKPYLLVFLFLYDHYSSIFMFKYP